MTDFDSSYDTTSYSYDTTSYDTGYGYDTTSYDTGYGYDTTSYDTGYDATAWTDLSNGLSDASWSEWDASIDYTTMANDAWASGQMDLYHLYTDAATTAEANSWDLYDASWDAWYGPVNAEGYTAYDASMGYSAYDTSFIEPASAADNTSLISDYDATSVL
ncbi:MAG: hypothetical protein U0Q03_06110 [Acidimicrobiales bacterium]